MSCETPLPPHAIVVRNPDQISADLDGEVVLFSLDNGKYYNMNEVGSRIWAVIVQPISVASLIDLLVREFEVERTICQEEVLSFLSELHAGGLVQLSEPETYRRKAAVEMRPLIGAGVLVDGQGNHFGVNQVGVRIWDLLEDAASIEAVVETLQREFDVSAARCREEAETFVGELLERGLIERSEGQ